MASKLVYRRLRAPQGDGGLLLEPAWPQCLELPAQNRHKLASFNFPVLTRSFQVLRDQVRESVCRLARAHSGQYLDVSGPPIDLQRPLIVTGHQPELFHPGVWAKNFAIHDLARAVDGDAINIVIDNDECRNCSIRLPVGSIEKPSIALEPYDHFDLPVPYEMRCVKQPELFQHFHRRVRDRLAPLIQNPLIADLWPEAIQLQRNGLPLGYAIAGARHKTERRWGLNTLEVPLSQIADTEMFRIFFLDIASRGADFRRFQNHHLSEYRQLHRLRSPAQPLPDLKIDQDGWVELPFWVWSTEAPQRRPIWCRAVSEGLELSDREAIWRLGKLHNGGALADLSHLRKQGLRIRPRAITNTMFTRLFLADLFVHGIGGAKYDQITDRIIHDLYQIDATEFVVLSLTTCLPVPIPRVGGEELTHLGTTLREMWHHPEQFLDEDQRTIAKVSTSIEEKRQWIGRQVPREDLHVRHTRIMQANERLREYLREKRRIQQDLIGRRTAEWRAARLLGARDWSFALFPEEFLRARLLDWSRQNDTFNAE